MVAAMTNGTPIADFEARKRINELEKAILILAETMGTQSVLNKEFTGQFENFAKALKTIQGVLDQHQKVLEGLAE